ncbi:MAG: hypothetical protein PVH87_28730 [Desulfobacteraceae bacterium]
MTGQKLKFVISDLHLGAGHTREGVDHSGNHLEDFIADQELVSFLREIWLESERDQREIELIINGDFFEFLQVPAVEHYNPAHSYPAEAYLDSSENASVQRLNVISRGHPEVFNALSDFMHVEHPQRRITMIKGNHDVNLFWPRVKSRLREILGASGTRASLLLFADEFVSREKIYVEHGHQRAEDINSYQDFFNPRSPDDFNQLYYPTGSRFVINFLNQIESQHWFVDHIKPISTLIWYALHWNFDFAAKILVDFVRHAITSALEETISSNADVETLLQELADDDKRREMSQRYAGDITFRYQFHTQIQQFLQIAQANGQAEGALPEAQISHNPLEMGQANQQQQQYLLRCAAEEVAQQEGAQVIVFGHTHYPVQEQLSTGSIYINTGSWVEDFSDAQPETWEALFNGSLQLVDGSPRLSYARIDYDEHDIPTARLLYFGQKTDLGSQSKAKKKIGWLIRMLGGSE